MRTKLDLTLTQTMRYRVAVWLAIFHADRVIRRAKNQKAMKVMESKYIFGRKTAHHPTRLQIAACAVCVAVIFVSTNFIGVDAGCRPARCVVAA